MNSIIKILSQLTQQKKVFPFYHAVADEVPLHLKHLYHVRSQSLFEADVDFFKANYKSLNIEESQTAQKGFYLSFDDGLREFKANAWPILKEKGITVLLFVNPAFVGNKELFYRFKASLIIEELLVAQSIDLAKINKELNQGFDTIELLMAWVKTINYANRNKLDLLAQILAIDFETYLEQQKPYLTLGELKELQAEGVIIGSHSMDHPLFNELDYDAQLKQINESVNWVSKHFNPSVSAFSFPFTDFGLSQRIFDAIYNHNDFNLDITFGTAGLKKERFASHIQRIPMEDNFKSAKQILLGEYLYYLAKAPFFKNTIRR